MGSGEVVAASTSGRPSAGLGGSRWGVHVAVPADSPTFEKHPRLTACLGASENRLRAALDMLAVARDGAAGEGEDRAGAGRGNAG